MRQLIHKIPAHKRNGTAHTSDLVFNPRMTLLEISHHFARPRTRIVQRDLTKIRAREDTISRCRELLAKLPAGTMFSHVTALRIYGLPIPGSAENDTRVHVTYAHQKQRSQSRKVVSHHLTAHALGAPTRVARLPVMSPEWTWLLMCERISDADATVLADALTQRNNPLSTMNRLNNVVDDVRNLRGIQRARLALTLARPGTDSPMETLTRLVLVLSDLPEPQVNAVISDDRGGYVCRPDLLFAQWKVVVEYDGDVHRTDRRTWQRDNEKRRLLTSLGYHPIYVTSDDIFLRPQQLVQQVREALVRRGYRRA